MKTISHRKVEIEIERPNGKVETIVHPKIEYFNDKIFAEFNKAMKASGRGKGLSYHNIEAVVEMEESDYQGHCKSCRRVLQQVGIGEKTAMEDRAADVPSYEPTHKPEADA